MRGIEAAQIYKTEKYADHASSLKRESYQVKVLAAEIGARVFVGVSAYNLMKQLSIEGREKNRALKAMAEAPERCSSWIWSRRHKNELHKA